MRFRRDSGLWSVDAKFTFIVGEASHVVDVNHVWPSFGQRKLIWRWPNGSHCELWVPCWGSFGDHAWYVEIDGNRVCNGVLRGQFPDWVMHTEWQCGDCHLLIGRLKNRWTFQCVKSADQGQVLALWRNCGSATEGVIRNQCNLTLQIVAFSMMLTGGISED